MEPYIAVDTECTGLNFAHGDSPFAVVACTSTGDIYFWEWDVDPFTRTVYWSKKDIKEIEKLVIKYRQIVFHNAKFDLQALIKLGLHLPLSRIEDTILAHHVLDNSEPHNLDFLADEYLNTNPLEKDLKEETIRARAKGKRRGWLLGTSPQGKAEVPRDYWMCKAVKPKSTILQEYAEQDAINTARLWKLFNKQIEKDNLSLQYSRRKKLIPCVLTQELRGVTVSRSRINTEISRYNKAANKHDKVVKKIAKGILKNDDFNPNSSVQLRELLYENFNIPITNHTITGLPSTDKNTLTQIKNNTQLEEIAQTFIENLIESKKNQTAFRYLSSYESYMVRKIGNRLFSSINMTGTNTTRFSSSNPNSQNIGKGDEWEDSNGTIKEDFKLREVFGPMTGRVWFASDYNQLQLRILAFASEDKILIKAFEEGYDFHAFVASRIFKRDPDKISFKERRIAKNVNFGIIFGAGEARIDATCGVPGLYQTFRSLFPSVDRYMASNTKQVKKHGYVKTLGGYRLWVSRDKPYKGTNFIIQGTEGDIVQEAMRNCYSLLEEKYNFDKSYHSPYICLQVHDELVFDFPNTKQSFSMVPSIEIEMEKAGKRFGVISPVDTDVITEKWSKGQSFSSFKPLPGVQHA